MKRFIILTILILITLGCSNTNNETQKDPLDNDTNQTTTNQTQEKTNIQKEGPEKQEEQEVAIPSSIIPLDKSIWDPENLCNKNTSSIITTPASKVF